MFMFFAADGTKVSEDFKRKEIEEEIFVDSILEQYQEKR